MPTYDYECRNCGHRVEVLHGVNASGPTACERCGGPMRKLVSTPNIVFKGSGWAKKDARDARPASTSASSSAKAEATDASAVKSSESSGADSGTKKESTTKATEGTGSSSGPKDPSAGTSSAD